MATLPTSFAARPRCTYCGSTEAIKLASSFHYVSTSKTSQSTDRVSVKNELIHRGLPHPLKMTHHKHRFRVCAMSRVSTAEVDEVYTHSPKADKQEQGLDYRFWTETGGQVKVSVKKMSAKYAVNIEASSLQQASSNDTLSLSWGVYRSDSKCCQSLDFKNTDANAITFEKSLFTQTSEDEYALELEFESEKAPFFLSFLLNSDSSEIRSHRYTKFCVPVGLNPGKPSPLGLSFSADGSVNFAIFSRDVEGVVLCLFDKLEADKPALELDLDPYVNRSGDIWHVSLQNTRNFTAYGYRIKGRDSKRLILDPYAKVLGALQGSGSNYLGLLSKVPTFDWSGDVRPNLPIEKLIVYRLNVQRFTEHNSSELPSDIAGTFSGLVEKLNHFTTLGVNAVLLEPIFPCDAQKGPYYPSHFFSPFSAINSVKEAVKRLHSSGIEVFLEVVFTHTAESGSLQGINDAYYYATESRSDLNCNFPVLQELIIDSLRYWVTEFHIDGFCFVNASGLLRGFHGETLSRPPLVEAIAFDPILSRTKIIADCYDPTDPSQAINPKPGFRFPHWKKWAEMNTKFCSDIRNFLRGEALLSDLATRLCGSGDMFLDGRGPAFSFNFIARNSGLSLVDLVSFSKDGLSLSELSWNCGEEGPTDKLSVLEKRLKNIRNFLFILYLSLGVPVLNMGDECGESTGGSTSYLSRKKPFNWKTLKTSFAIQTTEFISFLTSFRVRRADLFQKRSFLEEENIDWRSSSNESAPNWDDPKSKFLAMTLKTGSGSDVFVAFNASKESEEVVLPTLAKGMVWNRLVDTGLAFPGFFSGDGERVVGKYDDGLVVYEMKSHSCALFEAKAVVVAAGGAGKLVTDNDVLGL